MCVLRFLLKQSAELTERMEKQQTVPCTGCCDGERPISKWWNCAQYCRGPRLSRPESSSAVCSCGPHDELHPIRWSTFMQTAMNHHAQLVINASLDEQPVMLAKQWCDVFSSWCIRDQSYGGTEDGLQVLEVAGWQSCECEHDVAVIQSTAYEACDECVESVNWQRLLDASYLPQWTVAHSVWRSAKQGLLYIIQTTEAPKQSPVAHQI